MTQAQALDRLTRAIDEITRAGLSLTGAVQVVPAPHLQTVLTRYPAGLRLERRPLPPDEGAVVTLKPKDPTPGPALAVLTAPKLTKEVARTMGYTGDTCMYCGSARMRHNGTCQKCEECGQTSGCS